MFYPYSDVMIEKGIPWQNVLNVERKLVTLRKLGRWLGEKTRVAREQSLQLDSLNIVGSLSDRC
jgi:hypothetical protein